MWYDEELWKIWADTVSRGVFSNCGWGKVVWCSHSGKILGGLFWPSLAGRPHDHKSHVWHLAVFLPILAYSGGAFWPGQLPQLRLAYV